MSQRPVAPYSPYARWRATARRDRIRIAVAGDGDLAALTGLLPADGGDHIGRSARERESRTAGLGCRVPWPRHGSVIESAIVPEVLEDKPHPPSRCLNGGAWYLAV